MTPEEIRENAHKVINQKGREGIEVVDMEPQTDSDYVIFIFSDDSTVLCYREDD